MSRLFHIADWPSRAGPTLGPGGGCLCNHLVSCGGSLREQESVVAWDDESKGSKNDIKVPSTNTVVARYEVNEAEIRAFREQGRT